MTNVQGAVRIAPRAIQHAVRAAAAEALGAPPSRVHAEVVQRGDALELQIASPVQVGALPLVEAAEAARKRLVTQVARFTGANLKGCTLRVTGCLEAAEPRVR